jgi:hypothetical protein
MRNLCRLPAVVWPMVSGHFTPAGCPGTKGFRSPSVTVHAGEKPTLHMSLPSFAGERKSNWATSK